jgi:hypothetical protein
MRAWIGGTVRSSIRSLARYQPTTSLPFSLASASTCINRQPGRDPEEMREIQSGTVKKQYKKVTAERETQWNSLSTLKKAQENLCKH